MKVVEIVKNGFNNTSFTVANKASNMSRSVSRIINCYYTISVFVTVLKVLASNREITLCIPKLW